MPDCIRGHSSYVLSSKGTCTNEAVGSRNNMSGSALWFASRIHGLSLSVYSFSTHQLVLAHHVLFYMRMRFRKSQPQTGREPRKGRRTEFQMYTTVLFYRACGITVVRGFPTGFTCSNRRCALLDVIGFRKRGICFTTIRASVSSSPSC